MFFKAYLKSIYFDGGREALEDFEKKMEIPADRCDEVFGEISSLKTDIEPDDIDEKLTEWIQEYHSSVDQ